MVWNKGVFPESQKSGTASPMPSFQFRSRGGNLVLLCQGDLRPPLVPLAAFTRRDRNPKVRRLPPHLQGWVHAQATGAARRSRQWDARVRKRRLRQWDARARKQRPRCPGPVPFSLRTASLRCSDSLASTPACTHGSMHFGEWDAQLPADVNDTSWLNQYGSFLPVADERGHCDAWYLADADGRTRDAAPFSANFSERAPAREGPHSLAPSAPASPPPSPRV